MRTRAEVAMVLGLACGTEPVPPTVMDPVGLAAVAGNNQRQVPGVALFVSPTIRMVGADGHPVLVSGVPIHWSIHEGGGSVVAHVDTTNANGFASAMWTLGSAPGPQRLEAAATGLAPAVFVAEARPPGPIVFVSGRSGLVGNEFEGYPGDLYAMDDDGTHVMPLFSPAVGVQYLSRPRWSPDGRDLLFARATGRPAGGIPGLLLEGVFRMAVTSLEEQQVPAAGLPFYTSFYVEPSWSPNGQQVVVHLDTAVRAQNIPPNVSPGQLHVMSRAGLGENAIPVPVSLALSPDWAPQTDRIVFVCVGIDWQDLCVVNPDGTNFTRLTDDPEVDEDPVWSPDGTRLLWVRDRAGHGGVWVMNADGTAPSQVMAGAARSPAWAPDGTRFLVTLDTAGTQDIFLVDVATGASRNLTNTRFRDRDPTWRR